MKKTLSIKWSWLLAAIILFAIYTFWFSGRHSRNLITGDSPSCRYKNGNYPSVIEYYNPQTKAEQVFHAVVRIEDCSIIKITFTEKNKDQESIILPAELDSDAEIKVEDEMEGIYSVKIN
jgi:hypothetical protein